MMSREFTPREKILMLVLCVLLLGIMYFQFIVRDVNETIEKYNTEELETELLMEQTKAMQIKQMEQELKNADPGTLTLVASYNNVKNELNELNDIFSAANAYNLEFAVPVKEGSYVRRDIHVVFSAGSYSSAEAIIKKIHDCRYRCLIQNLSINNGSGIGIQSGTVSANMTVTFFETMYDATTTKGLEVIDDKKQSSKKTE